MKKNMGKADKRFRIIMAMIIAILYFTDTVNGTVGNILMALGIIFLLTSLISVCPLYIPMGINTDRKKKEN